MFLKCCVITLTIPVAYTLSALEVKDAEEKILLVDLLLFYCFFFFASSQLQMTEYTFMTTSVLLFSLATEANTVQHRLQRLNAFFATKYCRAVVLCERRTDY